MFILFLYCCADQDARDSKIVWTPLEFFQLRSHICLNDKHMVFLTLECPVAVVTTSFWSVSGRKSYFHERRVREKKQKLMFLFILQIPSGQKSSFSFLLSFFSLINEAFSLRLNPSITLTSINIHKYSFILLITTNQTYFIINLSLPPDYALCFAASAFIIYLNWAEAAHCGQSWFAPPSGFIWKVQL